MSGLILFYSNMTNDAVDEFNLRRILFDYVMFSFILSNAN